MASNPPQSNDEMIENIRGKQEEINGDYLKNDSSKMMFVIHSKGESEEYSVIIDEIEAEDAESDIALAINDIATKRYDHQVKKESKNINPIIANRCRTRNSR